MTLAKHVLYTAFQKAPHLVAIAAIIGLTMGIYTGIYSAIEGLPRFITSYYETSNMSDLEVRISTDDAVNVPDFSSITGLAAVERRLSLPGVVTLKDKKVSFLLVGRPDVSTDGINKIRAMQGNFSDSIGRNIVLERNCANYHNLSVGDHVEIKLGYDLFDVKVIAIGESPEFLISPANPAAFLPTDGSLCVGYVSLGWLQKRLGFDAINGVLFRYQDNFPHEIMRKQIIDLISQYNQIEQTLRQNEQFSYLFLDVDLKTFKIFVPAVVMVFSLSSFFVVLFLGFQWISTERSQIGMMMALGFSSVRIVATYSLIALFIFALSTLFAWPLSLIALKGFGTNFASAIGMPEPELALLGSYFMNALLGAALLVILAMALPLFSIFKMTPIDAVGEPKSSSNAPPFVIRRRSTRLPIWARLSLRNTLRRPVVSLATILSIALCFGMTISFSISMTSMERTAIASFKSDKWLAIVDLARFAWTDQLSAFYELAPESEWAGIVRGNATVSSPDGEVSVFIAGIDFDSRAKHLALLAGKLPTNNEVVVEATLARDIQLQVGDRFDISVAGHAYETRVAGIHSGSMPGELWTNLGFAQFMLGRDEQISGLFYLGDPSRKNEINEDKIMMLPDVVNVFTQQEAVDAVLSMSSKMWVILYIGSLFSIVGAILFIFSNLSFSILSREGEYAMMRVLGYSHFKVNATILVEVFIIAIIAITLAPIFGYIIGYVLNDRLTQAWFKVETQPALKDFVLTLGPALLLTSLGALPAIYRIARIAIPEAVRFKRFQ